PNTNEAEGTTARPGGQERSILKILPPYLWPQGRGDLKLRVIVAIVSLILAKLASVAVPFFYREAVDRLDADASIATGVIVVPVMLIVGYGVSRVMMLGFAQLRDGIFAKVSQHALRSLALHTFKHIHELSLQFHLDRHTGGLARIIERGTKGVDFLLRYIVFNIGPVIIEVLMVSAILYTLFDYRYLIATLSTVALFIIFTFVVTEWRTRHRRRMHESDGQATTRAVDSLLNYETVKYFGTEAHEAQQYDRSMGRYESAAVDTQVSLSLLNTGQEIIVAVGLVSVMVMAGFGVADGELSLGDFVLVNTFMIQLYAPLNLLGFVYREIRQSLIDMENMFELLQVEQKITDQPDAPPLQVSAGEVEFKNVTFGYESGRTILKNISFKVPKNSTVAIIGP
ncbi:MAG: ABC transporter ATP-binding protein/permease, partial [Gammaproteobacteria bacterium]